MEMFEGKKGPKVFAKRHHAEFASGRAYKAEKEDLEIIRVKIIDEEKAKKNGVSYHRDLSIASSPPKKGLRGWVVVENPEGLKERGLESVDER